MPMSNTRGFVVKVGHVLLLLQLLMLLLVPQRPAQNIPRRSNSFVKKQEASTFHNGHLMIHGLELKYYLFNGTLRNLILNSEAGPLLIVVTPCASSVSWTLSRKLSGSQEHSWAGQQQKGRETLRTFSGETRESFVQMDAPAAIYTLAITSLDSDSWVKVYVTSDPDVRGSIYPQVPLDHQVTVQANKRSLRLDWPSASAVNHKNLLEYCVTISRIRNFRTHCGALAYLRGDVRPSVVRWGGPEEKKQNRELRRKSKPVAKAPSRMIFHQCVGNNTSFTHSKVRRGKTYYIDVFVRDKKQETASSYLGTSVTIKKRKRSLVKMNVGETKTINLKRRKGVKVTLNTPERRLAFEVIPCADKVPFKLFQIQNGKMIPKETKGRHRKRQVIRNAAPGTYLMTFPGKKKKKKKAFVTVYITSKPSRSKVAMPKRKRIFVRERLTTCSSVTVAWKVEPVDQKYCLYNKRLKKNGRDSRRRKCLSPSERSQSEQVTCMDYKAATNNTEISYGMSNLRPDTWYRFDVFVSRDRSAAVSYKSVKVKTLAKCTDS